VGSCEVHVSVFRAKPLLPERSVEGSKEAENELDHNGDENVVVGTFFNLGFLLLALRTVHHYLGVVARVHTNAIDPLAVTKGGPTEKEHVRAQRNSGPVWQFHDTLKVVNKLIWLLTLNLSSIEMSGNSRFVTCHTADILIGLLMLQVSFSIKILGLNIADTLGVCAVE
jgi:hypothetical protein